METLLISFVIGVIGAVIWTVYSNKGKPKNKIDNSQNNQQSAANRNTYSSTSVVSSVYKEPSAAQYNEYMNSPIKNAHYNYLTREIDLYKKICQSEDYKGRVADELIKVCNEDIAISTNFYKLSERCNYPIPLYPAFKYLAMLFEKREEYQEAINVCKLAIAKGYSDDDTKSGMQGRIARLEKKMTRKANETQ